MKRKAKILAEGNPLEFVESPGDLQALPGDKGSMPSVSLGNRTVASPSESVVKADIICTVLPLLLFSIFFP